MEPKSAWCFMTAEPGDTLKRNTAMERFIHRENMALFRKRLAEPCDDAQYQILLKLLAEEEARELPFKAVEAASVDPLSP